jgi:4-methyl-5(b-hydroxyethyl)-thiazole monophosphate biosynthesis
MPKEVLVPVADGSEEIEAVCIIDVLRRAGAEVTVASAGDQQITASRGVRLVADTSLSTCIGKTYDLIVLPGGSEGAKRLRDSAELITMLKKQKDENRLFAAICASPVVVLQHHGLLDDRAATSHPSVSGQLEDQTRVDERVVVDSNCVTSRGPGTAIEFALKLVELMFGENKSKEVAGPMLVC